MFKLILALLLFSYSVTTFADEWTSADSYRETTFQVLNIIDWGQTRYIAQHPEKFRERPSSEGGISDFIGSKPTEKGVDSFMLKVSVIHAAISYFLPNDWRDAFQYVTIGMKLNATIGNASIGIKVSF